MDKMQKGEGGVEMIHIRFSLNKCCSILGTHVYLFI